MSEIADFDTLIGSGRHVRWVQGLSLSLSCLLREVGKPRPPDFTAQGMLVLLRLRVPGARHWWRVMDALQPVNSSCESYGCGSGENARILIAMTADPDHCHIEP